MIKCFPNLFTAIDWSFLVGKQTVAVDDRLDRHVPAKTQDVFIHANLHVGIQREHTWSAELHQNPELIFVQV